jgi:hypothetical protein
VRRVALGAAIAASLALARAAAAQGAPPVTVTAAPIFGGDAATGNGWNEIVARVDNAGTAPARGTIELAMATSFGAGELAPAARAPFAVPPGRSAVVAIPLHGFSAYYAPQVTLTATSEDGAAIATTPVTLSAAGAPMLVEVAQPARLGVALRGWPVPIRWSTAATSSAGANHLATGAPAFDRATGDPILPDRAAGYASATVVLARSDTLVALDDARRAALVDWVNGGGTLAVVVARPEDLRAPLVASLVGGEAARAAPPARLFALLAFAKPSPESPLGDEGDEPDPDAVPSPGAPTPPPMHALRSGPAAPTAATLAGYEGGRLHASDVGATASYGLGEVHLLAFDPMAQPAIDDPWTQTRVVEMVARAWDRRARVALPVGGGDRGTSRIDEIRRALDPNESYRFGLAFSTVLLVLYAVACGPIVFTRAARKRAPLLPLVWVPACSAVAFVAIVVVGLGVKGWRGRARHLVVLEAASGATRASSRAYRGFFASETRSLTVPATTRASVLALASSDVGTRVDQGLLRVDRDGATLGGITSLPWQTVIVREDGAADLARGVVVRASGGDVVVENHTGHVLKDVVVHGPKGGGAAYFATIDDGEAVDFPRGRALAGVGGAAVRAGKATVHPLGAAWIAAAMPGREGKRVADTWAAVEQAAGEAIDWWPDDAPALVGEIVGAPHAPKDAGLSLESERVLLRVVGETS